MSREKNFLGDSPLEKFISPDKTSSELEAEHFAEYISIILRQKGEIALAEMVENGAINTGLDKRKAIETGNLAEGVNPNEFDISGHMQMRAELCAAEIIKNKDKYLN